MSGKRKKRQKQKAARPESKSNKPKNTTDKVPTAKKSKLKKLISIVLGFIGILSAILGIWTALPPKVFVEPGAALDPNNPAFTPFIIQNQGSFSIHDVKFSCSMKYIKYPGDILVVGLGDYTNRFTNEKHVANVIAPREQYTEFLPLKDMENNVIENADIAIVLTFKPVRWLWRRKTLHRFVSTQGKDGQWYWFPQPIKK